MNDIGSVRSENYSIVVVGDFNPDIFQPRWPPLVAMLEPWGVASSDDIKIEVIHEDFCRLESLKWKMTAERRRLSVEDREPNGIRIGDFIRRLFSDFLPHTPVRAVGINYTCEIEADNSRRNAIGYALAPAEPWGEFADQCRSNHGGVNLLQVRLHEEGVDPEQYAIVSIQPSPERNDRFGLRVNNHFGQREDDHRSAPEFVSDAIDQFDELMAKSRAIRDQLLSLGASS